MFVVAHIGNIPVEEWVPFLVPVLGLYFWGRRKDRRRSKAVERLPEASEALDEHTITLVVDRWTKRDFQDLSPTHLSVLYPPGPEGRTADEIAARTRTDPVIVARLLTELEELGYVEIEKRNGSDEPRVWLTMKGCDVLYETETALLSASAS